MKALFVNVPFVKYDNLGRVFTGPNAGSRWPWTLPGHTIYACFPFFMGYACSYLHRHGMEADLYDGVAMKRWDYELVKQDLLARPADVVIFEVATPLARAIAGIARFLKEKTGCRIVLVGPHIAVYADDLLKESYVDHCVVGEYEKPVLDIVRRGSAARRKFMYEHVENINTLDGKNWLPYRPMDYLYNYWEPTMDTPRTQLQVNTSRGCPFKCTYCQWPKVMNNGQYRAREPEMVLDEIRTVMAQTREFLNRRAIALHADQQARQLEAARQGPAAGALRKHALGLLPANLRTLPCGDDRRGIQSIMFDDDTWNLGNARITRLCKGLKEIGLPWTMMGRIDTSPLALYDLMVECGCVGMRFGVESFNQRLVDNAKKHLNTQKSYENIKYLITHFKNMEFHFTTMKNLPGETAQDWENDQVKLRELQALGASNNNRVHWQNSDCVAFPGTELWEEMVALGKGEELRNFELYDGGVHNDAKLAQAIGWLGEDYKPKFHKYSKMGDPELLPKDTRQAMEQEKKPLSLPVVNQRVD
jgi:radical SAM superfamily enzyme YgiQ (UPF0313 family)